MKKISKFNSKFSKQKLANCLNFKRRGADTINRNKKEDVGSSIKKYFWEYHTLFYELEHDEISFYKYIMSQDQFYKLFSKIENQIQKKNTTFQEAITPKEKLIICLR